MPAITFEYQGNHYKAFYYKVDENDSRIDSYSVEIIDGNFNNGKPSHPYSVRYFRKTKEWNHHPENDIGRTLEKAVIKDISDQRKQ